MYFQLGRLDSTSEENFVRKQTHTWPRYELMGSLIMMLAAGNADRWPFSILSLMMSSPYVCTYLCACSQKHRSFSPGGANSDCVHRWLNILDRIIYCECLRVVSVFLTILARTNYEIEDVQSSCSTLEVPVELIYSWMGLLLSSYCKYSNSANINSVTDGTSVIPYSESSPLVLWSICVGSSNLPGTQFSP